MRSRHTVMALSALQNRSFERAIMATPVFESVTRERDMAQKRPKYMVVVIQGIGPTLACTSCGNLSDVHSTDLDVLNEWAIAHANEH